jgi:hypothetical protein
LYIISLITNIGLFTNSKAMIKAVITGDIVHSTQMSQKDRDMLIKIISRLLKDLSNEFSMRSEMYRGDSFQCLLSKPGDALRVALLIKTGIRSLNPSEAYELQKKSKPDQKKSMLYTNWVFDARMAIGIGEVEKPKTKISTSTGSAFIISGHGLDDLKNSKQALAIETFDKFREELQTESILLDTILSKTTALQCEVIHNKLQYSSEIEIARKLKIGQSAVNQRSNAGSWNAINAMVQRFETIYEK